METTTNPAIIAAVSALAGVFLSQAFSMLQSRLEREHRRKALLRDKLEDLTQNLMQTIHWVDQWRQWYSARGTKSGQSAQVPLHSSEQARRLYVLSLLYFPHLKDESQRVMKALNVLCFAGVGSNAGDELSNALEQFSAAKRALEGSIATEAKKLL